ncbi:hypothetical protein ABID95_001184 [Streptomyces atratus]
MACPVVSEPRTDETAPVSAVAVSGDRDGVLGGEFEPSLSSSPSRVVGGVAVWSRPGCGFGGQTQVGRAPST